KGLFFLVTLWGMFFYGSWLGRWRNVYLPHQQEWLLEEEGERNRFRAGGTERPLRFGNWTPPPVVGNLYTRWQYLGQFWIGAAARHPRGRRQQGGAVVSHGSCNLLALAPALLAAASIYWHFPILVVLVNLVYSATRYDDWGHILVHAGRGMVYILFFLLIVFG